jgi:hypothetical protein
MQICHQISCVQRQPFDDHCFATTDFMQNYHNPGRTSFQLLVPAAKFYTARLFLMNTDPQTVAF